MDEDQIWKILGTATAVAAASAAKPAVAKSWAKARGAPPPGNPAGADTGWGEALAWALFSGAVVGVIRLVAQRMAAEAWRKKRGDYPPALRSTHA